MSDIHELLSQVDKQLLMKFLESLSQEAQTQTAKTTAEKSQIKEGN